MGKSLPATTSVGGYARRRSAGNVKGLGGTAAALSEVDLDLEDDAETVDGRDYNDDEDLVEDDDGIDLDLDDPTSSAAAPVKRARKAVGAATDAGAANGKKKKETLLRCERCNKVYHHPQSLIKREFEASFPSARRSIPNAVQSDGPKKGPRRVRNNDWTTYADHVYILYTPPTSIMQTGGSTPRSGPPPRATD